MEKLTFKKIQENFNKKYQEVCKSQEKRDAAFKELMDLSGELGLPRYCCAADNLKQLIGTEKEGRAFYLYDIYVTEGAKKDLMNDLYFDIIQPVKGVHYDI
jgi:DNA-directed RNA polymerase subunit N (RpoN/RPB10)